MKRGIIIVLVIVLLLIIALGLFFIFSGNSDNCLVKGEAYSSESNKECCEGLTLMVDKPDFVSIEGECYWIGIETDKETVICSNCGNGKCEPPEDFCQCPQDCKESNYASIQDFCSNGHSTYCSNPEKFEISQERNLELCELC